MNSNTALKFAPAFADDKRIDVSVDSGEATIRLSNWVDELGWCPQKTMSLDAASLDELHRLVTAARLKLKRQAADAGVLTEQSNVLEFPHYSS